MSIDLHGRSVLVVGLGRSGLAAARLCRDRGATLTVTDNRSAEQLSDVMTSLGADVRAELGLAAGALVVGCVGEVGWRKGQEHVLAAADALRERFPAVKWLVVGEGDGVAELTARARSLGLLRDDRVRFLGFRRDVPAVLAACDVLVLPSRSEGFPNTLLEGMALGLPVAASRADGIPELVVDGETGLLHAVDDTAGFVEDVSRLMDDGELRARLGAAGARRAREVFGQERVMGMVEECLCRWDPPAENHVDS